MKDSGRSKHKEGGLFGKIWSGERQQLNHGEQPQTPITVNLNVNQKFCEAGGHIQGTVSMFVPQSATGCDDFTGINISLVGQEIVKLRDSSAKDFLSEVHQREIVQISAEIVQLLSPLMAGQFEYPFCWQLPADKTFPVTMSCSSPDASSCHIKYDLTAFLSSKSPGASEDAVVFSEKPIRIIGSGRNVIDIDNIHDEDSDIMIAEPKTFGVKSWMKNKGCIEMGLNADTKVASPDSMVAVGVTGRGNLSAVPIDELLIQWEESVQWCGKYGGEREHCRVLAQETVSVHDAPQWQAREKNNDKKESTAQAEKKHGNKIIRFLDLDKSARDSYQGCLIKVQHSINVIAITRGRLISNPKFTTPIEIYREQLKQPHFGALSTKHEPCMAKVAQLSSLSVENTDTDNPQYRSYLDNQIQSDIKIPRAIPIDIDNHNDIRWPAVHLGETEQYNPFCDSTGSAVVLSGSSSPHFAASQQNLEPVLAMAVLD